MLKVTDLVIIKKRGDNLDLSEKITTFSCFIKCPEMCKYQNEMKNNKIFTLNQMSRHVEILKFKTEITQSISKQIFFNEKLVKVFILTQSDIMISA
jgi:hypothetical protein